MSLSIYSLEFANFSVCVYVCVSVWVAQSCPTLFNSMDCNLPGFSVHRILQARTLEWVAIPYSRGSPWPRDQTRVSCTAGRFFTIWATMQALAPKSKYYGRTSLAAQVLRLSASSAGRGWVGGCRFDPWSRSATCHGGKKKKRLWKGQAFWRCHWVSRWVNTYEWSFYIL